MRLMRLRSDIEKFCALELQLSDSPREFKCHTSVTSSRYVEATAGE